MNDLWNEDERLAAFLDGRLEARERAEMLSHLTEDDETYEVFVGLTAILRQAEAEDSGADAAADRVTPFEERVRTQRDRPRPGEARWGAVKRLWMALAAALVAVMLTPSSTLRVRASLTGDPVRLVAHLEHASDRLPAGWKESPTWLSSR